MEFSPNAVVGRMLLILFVVAVLISAGGVIFYRSPDAVPFIVGVFFGASSNAFKLLWIKRTVIKAVDLNTNTAKTHLAVQHLLRNFLTVVVLLAAVFIPDQFVNLIGTALGILITMPVATYSIKLFIKDENPDLFKKNNQSDDAIEEINKIVTESETAAENQTITENQTINENGNQQNLN